MNKLVSRMTGLAFAKVINKNADELDTTKKIKFEKMTAGYLAKTLNEQLSELESGKEITFKTGDVIEVYNEAITEAQNNVDVVPTTVDLNDENPDEVIGNDLGEENPDEFVDELDGTNEDIEE